MGPFHWARGGAIFQAHLAGQLEVGVNIQAVQPLEVALPVRGQAGKNRCRRRQSAPARGPCPAAGCVRAGCRPGTHAVNAGRWPVEGGGASAWPPQR